MLVPGQIVEVEVQTVAVFGVFCRHEDQDMLVLISETSWIASFCSCHQFALPGDRFTVKILHVDAGTGTISASIKDMHPDPWAASLLTPGTEHQARVVRYVAKADRCEDGPGYLLELVPGGYVMLSADALPLQANQQCTATVIESDFSKRSVRVVVETDARENDLEWSLFQNGSVLLYHRAEVLRNNLARLTDRGYVAHQFACSTWSSEADFHDALGSALGLPDYAYEGRNINAFNDRLCRIEFPGRCALVFWGYEVFAAQEPRFAQWVLDVLQEHSRQLLFWGKRLLALLQSDDVAVRFEPVGACPVLWAPREGMYVGMNRSSEGRIRPFI